ncbi:MAG: ferrochelatase [Betaproteobacteria bacterium]
MPRFRPEPPFAHDRSPKIGVLLVNLGTPDAPTPGAVRRYLAEFLSDPRVVEIPRAIWMPLLHGLVLSTRPRKSAAKYQKIWTRDGSPLLVHSLLQRSLLRGAIGEKLKALGLPSDHCAVELGMRYGNPSIGSGLDALRAAGAEKVLVFPLYPQYAASTTGTAFDAVAAHMAGVRWVPGLRFVDAFATHPGYVRAVAQIANEYWMKHGRPEQVVLSFHGLPKRTLDLGDPYHCQCHATARALARELGLPAAQWTLAFQSRFGKAQWLRPYTGDRLVALAKAGVRQVDVVCPGFVADCLETLEEIGIEARAMFDKAGGETLRVIPCLNEHPAWIAAMTDLALTNLQGWLERPPSADERAMTAALAKAQGAPR